MLTQCSKWSQKVLKILIVSSRQHVSTLYQSSYWLNVGIAHYKYPHLSITSPQPGPNLTDSTLYLNGKTQKCTTRKRWRHFSFEECTTSAFCRKTRVVWCSRLFSSSASGVSLLRWATWTKSTPPDPSCTVLRFGRQTKLSFPLHTAFIWNMTWHHFHMNRSPHISRGASGVLKVEAYSR